MLLILVVAVLCTPIRIHAISINCGFQMGGLNHIGSLYSCHVSTATVTTTPNQTITSITGTHSSGYIDASVKGLSFYSLTVNFFPLGIDAFYPNLEGLRISSCHLKAVEKIDIQSLTKLRELSFASNDLETLKRGLFDSNPALEYLDFQSNKLKSIGFNILKPLTKLTTAIFSSNTCIKKDATTAASITAIKLELNEKCVTNEEKLREKKDRDTCTTEATKLKSTTEKLEAEVKRLTTLHENAKAEIVSLKTRNMKVESEHKTEIDKLKTELNDVRQQLRATDENLNAATKSLYNSKKLVKKVEEWKDHTKEALLQANVTFNLAFNEQADNVPLLNEDTKLVCRDLKDKTVCDAYVFSVRYPEMSVEVVDQSHSVIPSNEMKTLTAVDQQTLFLPKNLANHFEKLTEISVVRSGLFEINPNVLEGMFDLKTLNFTANKLREVEDDTFKDQTDLTELDLSFNKIEVVNQGAFNGATKLKTLLLNDNLLVRIDGRAFEVLIKLQVLTLNNNILKYISPNLLSAFDELKSADLTNNKCVDMSLPTSSLSDIETTLANHCVAPIDFNCNFRVIKDLADGSSSYMCSPQKLVINNPKTRISTLKGKNIDGFGFNDVATLLISGQTAEFLPFEMSKTFSKLKRIIVENSKLAKIQAKDFEDLKLLNTIVVRGNKIKSIHSETFSDVPQLVHLDLSGNEIKVLPPGLFTPLTKLRTLKMSDNNLEKLTLDIFARKNEIEDFLFDNNQLEFIDVKVLKVLRKATLIDFSSNGCIDERVVDADNEIKKIALLGSISLKCEELLSR